jgi:hypothetical protein
MEPDNETTKDARTLLNERMMLIKQHAPRRASGRGYVCPLHKKREQVVLGCPYCIPAEAYDADS